MKLSKLQAEYDESQRGEWWHYRDTLFLRVRPVAYKPYQRALRLAQIEYPRPDPAPGQTRVAPETLRSNEEAFATALLPAIVKHLLSDWWGADDDGAPVAIEEHGPTHIVGHAGTYALVALEHEGRLYRPEGELWQPMLRYEPELLLPKLAEPAYIVLCETIRNCASETEKRRAQEDLVALGKLLARSGGGASTEPITTS